MAQPTVKLTLSDCREGDDATARIPEYECREGDDAEARVPEKKLSECREGGDATAWVPGIGWQHRKYTESSDIRAYGVKDMSVIWLLREDNQGALAPTIRLTFGWPIGAPASVP